MWETQVQNIPSVQCRHSSASRKKKSLEGISFGCFSIAWHIRVILCNFAMAVVNGRKSEGNGRLPHFFPTAVSLGAFYYVCIAV